MKPTTRHLGTAWRCSGLKRALTSVPCGRRVLTAAAVGATACSATAIGAQVGVGPQPTVVPTTLPPPKDNAFQGTIELDIDATDTAHGIVAVHEIIPVQAGGDIVLLYPEWEAASHAPTVPVASLAGLRTAVDGRPVEWRRDPFDVHAFHLPTPAGARQITLDFQYLRDRPAIDGEVEVPWQRLLLYPAGWFARDIPVAASLRLPSNLSAFTALEQAPRSGDDVRFVPTTLEHLVDAPVHAARFSRRIALSPGAEQPVSLDLLASDPDRLAIDAGETARMRTLVEQTIKVFGPAPYRHYDALVILDDAAGAGGVEHLEMGENSLPARYFLDPQRQLNNRDLIAHELVHAWNGRFRQPADLWTPAFNQPVGGSLLWVYEGQTEFWGRVLAARAGLRSRQETLDKLALDAALVANRPGRSWKSLADSTNDAIYMAGRHVGWRDWQRREDYYPEGVLLWLDVDARLRELTGGKRGIDAFTTRFFRSARPDGIPSTYTFDDVCRALDAVVHDDWAAFLRRHLDSHADADAMAGLARSGWELVYTPQPTETFRQNEVEGGGLDLTYSIGAVVDDRGRIANVAWNGPAFRAGIAPGARITRIGELPFSRDALRQAVADSTRLPLHLELAVDGHERVADIPYGQGLRYPRLERIIGAPDRLTPLLLSR